MTALRTAACDLLGCRYPVVLAGMGGVARAELVAAVAEAGGFGFLGMVRESPELIRREVGELRRLGHRRFGVNLIPAATPPALLDAELDACIDLGVPVVCLFWDIDPAVVRRLRAAGIAVAYQVGSADEARAAELAGAQLVIAQGIEAGGHVRGRQPLHDVLPQAVAAVDVPVLAAGGIADANDLVTALALGAQGVMLGTAMIPTPESFAHDMHKERLLAAHAGETVLTEAFHINWPAGAAVRVLASAVTEGRLGDPAAADRTVIGWEDGRPIYLFSTDSPLRSTAGDFEAMPLYAGMGVGRVTKMMGAGRRLRVLVEAAESLLRLPLPDADPEAASPVCYAGLSPEYMGYLRHDALLERLHRLCRLASLALLAARGDRSSELRYARWVLALRGLVEAVAGAAPAPCSGAGVTVDGVSLFAETRALLPLVFEQHVRDVLTALLSDSVGAAAPS